MSPVKQADERYSSQLNQRMSQTDFKMRIITKKKVSTKLLNPVIVPENLSSVPSDKLSEKPIPQRGLSSKHMRPTP